jgi:hypothetical protein
VEPEDIYEAQWRRYRLIYWRSFLLSTFLFLGGIGGTLKVFELWIPRAPGWLPFVSSLPWLFAAIFASQPPIKWLCPRCGRRFFSASWYTNGLASGCVHCGLPKWAPNDPDAA